MSSILPLTPKGGGGFRTFRTDIDSGPPSNPRDGDIWIAEDVGGENSGVVWPFIYNEDSTHACKWEANGCSPLSALVGTDEPTTSVYPTLADLATVGPQLTVPLLGEYIFEFGATSYISANVNNQSNVELAINGVGQGGNARVSAFFSALNLSSSPWTKVPISGTIAAGQVVKLMYAISSAGTARFFNRRLHMTPLRVSGPSA